MSTAYLILKEIDYDDGSAEQGIHRKKELTETHRVETGDRVKRMVRIGGWNYEVILDHKDKVAARLAIRVAEKGFRTDEYRLLPGEETEVSLVGGGQATFKHKYDEGD